MELDNFLKISLSIAGIIISASFAYLTHATKQLVTIYKARADFAEQKLNAANKDVEKSRLMIDIWEKTIQRLNDELLAAESKLGEKPTENIQLLENNEKMLSLIKQMRENSDPVADVSIDDLYPTDPDYGLR